MKIVIKLYALLLLISAKTVAQTDCSKLPSAKQLYNSILDKPVKVKFDNFNLHCNVNDSVKRQLLYLLNSKWTKNEIDTYIDKDIKDGYESYQIEKRTTEESNGNDSLYYLAKNKIINQLREDKAEYLRNVNYYGVDNSIIKLVAVLGFKEAITTLKAVLKDKSDSYDLETVELALAKLGEKKFAAKVLKDCMPDKNLDNEEWLNDFTKKFNKLIFIGSQESVFQIHHWIDTLHNYQIYSNGTESKASNRVIAFLSDYLANKEFRHLIKDMNLDSPCPCNVSKILACKKWLIKNRGKYIISAALVKEYRKYERF
jgi:hypothetical protein